VRFGLSHPKETGRLTSGIGVSGPPRLDSMLARDILSAGQTLSAMAKFLICYTFFVRQVSQSRTAVILISVTLSSSELRHSRKPA
jgi:hypothetical protein